jgi:hypothetical protein
MNTFKPDHRKINLLLFFGLLFLSLTYFTLNANSYATRIVWTIFLVLLGLIFIGYAFLYRYIITIQDRRLVVKSRFGFRRREIMLDEISRVKVLDKEYPVTLYNNTLLNVLLWDKKFNRFKQIELYDVFGTRIFIIDGQTVDNNEFTRLIKALKS